MVKTLTFTMIAPDGTFCNKIRVIKGLRNLTGMGLKEAKKLSEEIQNRNSLTISVNVTTIDLEEIISLIQSGGISVIDTNNDIDQDKLIEHIKNAIFSAVNSSHYDIARSLLGVLESNR